MENPTPDKPPLDGLEIISIGSLYTGRSWDKKYWSCSRGKERYPYPIGYHAVRTHAGNLYNMEIHEGHKGPLFVITSVSGESCFGQTPDIAWENFQKKSGPRVKSWHAKRFSCKIDGVELFGFKNPFVLRLLRQLVTNINEASACISVFTDVSNGDFELDCNKPCQQSCTYPDLLPLLERQKCTGRRSQKKRSARNCTCEDSSKTFCTQGLMYDAKVGFAIKGTRRKTVSYAGGHEADCFRQNDGLPDADLQVHDSLKSAEENVELLLPAERKSVEECGRHVSDTLDPSQDATPAIMQESDAIGNANANPQNSVSHSDGRKLLKSMIEVLLPYALPLLSQENIHLTQGEPQLNLMRMMSQDENSVGSSCAGIMSQGILENTKLVIPDSLEDDQAMFDVSNQKPLNFNLVHADTMPFNKNVGNTDMPGLQESTNEGKGFSIKCGGIREDSKNFAKVEDLMCDSAICHSLDNEEISFQEESDNQCIKKIENTSHIDMDFKTLNVIGPRNEAKLDQNHLESFIIENLPLDDISNGKTTDGHDIIPITEVRFNDPSASITYDGNIDVYSTRHHDVLPNHSRNHNTTLSESIICRNNGGIDNPKSLSTIVTTEIDQAMVIDDHSSQKISSINQLQGLYDTDNMSFKSDAIAVPANEVNHPEDTYLHSVPYKERCQMDAIKLSQDLLSGSKLEERKLMTDKLSLQIPKPNVELDRSFELVACYSHPTPVLSIFLRRKGEDIHICVLCGQLGDHDGTLFIYKLSSNDVKKESPLFLGYTSVMMSTESTFERSIAFERSWLQFACEGYCIVLLNKIKVPFCRQLDVNCLCSTCTSLSIGEDVVRVVRICTGYVSPMVNLRATESVYYILVCEPCYLIAIGESGRLHVWIFNSSWSMAVDNFILPSIDYNGPLLELKRIPKYDSLVIGHNGGGCFGLWDICNRVIVAKFFGADSVIQALPVGLFIWRTKKEKMEEHIKEMIASAPLKLSRNTFGNDNLSLNEEDIAIWLLVSTPVDTNTKWNPLLDSNRSPVGCKLALLVKNTVIMGSMIETRVRLLGLSCGFGIIGTCDGLVYMWELSTGRKLTNLHHFVGGVSCIATEEECGTLAVADNNGRLLLYVQDPRNSELEE